MESHIYRNLRKILNRYNKNMKEYKKFICNDIASFSKDVDILRNLIRYQNVHRNINESVAEHSFYTAIFVLKLREYYDFNLEIALKTALVHDFAESAISDVPHNIKISNPNLAKELERSEEIVNSTRLSNDAAKYIKDFNAGATPEGLAVQLADILSVVLYANAEIKSGNKVFNYIAIKALDRVKCVLSKLEPFMNKAYTNEQIVNKIN